MKRLILILGLVFVLSSITLAQTKSESQSTPVTQSPDDETAAIRLKTNLVNVNIKVTDITNRPIVDLKKEDFVILEDGVPQDVAFFQPITAPVNLVLLLDFSGSTQDKRKILLKAAKKFIDALNPDDRIAVVGFTRKIHLISTFTADRKLLKKRIDDTDDIGGGTGYYDAMWKTLDMLRTVKDTRKAIVVLTDGVDSSLYKNRGNYSYLATNHTFEELLDRAYEEDASVYPICLNTLEPPSTGGFLSKLFNSGDEKNYRDKRYLEEKKLYDLARQQLEAIAEATAGTMFTAEREEDLVGVYQRVAAELHLFYSLAYAPKKELGSGEFRKLHIKANREGAIAKTRKGYFAR
jgi:VWFA-related protein